MCCNESKSKFFEQTLLFVIEKNRSFAFSNSGRSWPCVCVYIDFCLPSPSPLDLSFVINKNVVETVAFRHSGTSEDKVGVTDPMGLVFSWRTLTITVWGTWNYVVKWQRSSKFLKQLWVSYYLVRLVVECRCDERLKTKAEESTRLVYLQARIKKGESRRVKICHALITPAFLFLPHEQHRSCPKNETTKEWGIYHTGNETAVVYDCNKLRQQKGHHR